MDPITLLLGIAVGVVIGILIATVAMKQATPQQLWDKLVWALDRAEGNPALRAEMEQAAAEVQKKLTDWLTANWKN